MANGCWAELLRGFDSGMSTRRQCCHAASRNREGRNNSFAVCGVSLLVGTVVVVGCKLEGIQALLGASVFISFFLVGLFYVWLQMEALADAKARCNGSPIPRHCRIVRISGKDILKLLDWFWKRFLKFGDRFKNSEKTKEQPNSEGSKDQAEKPKTNPKGRLGDAT